MLCFVHRGDVFDDGSVFFFLSNFVVVSFSFSFSSDLSRIVSVPFLLGDRKSAKKYSIIVVLVP